MLMVFLNLVFMFVMYDCYAAYMDEEVKNYFQHPDRRSMQETWMKYKRGFETSLEQLLQENYDGKGMNIFKRKTADFYKLSEGFMTVADQVVDVVFKDLYLLELPMMRSPKVWLTLGSNLLKVDAELVKVKVMAKYIVYRNDSVITYAIGNDMNKISPFSLQQVHTTGEVTIIGEECRLTGHAIATLGDQSINLGHNTFSLTDCKFKLEIWTPAQESPPVFARYFHDCDSNFLQNLISKPLQEELMLKLQGGIFSYVNISDVFGPDVAKYKARQNDCFKKVYLYMTRLSTTLNEMTATKTQGVDDIDMKTIGWTEAVVGGKLRKSVIITNITLYGLDTAYIARTGGPIEQNGQMYIEDTVGFNTLQVTGKLVYQSFHSADVPLREVTSTFSVEIHDLTVVIRIAVGNELKASNLDIVDKSKRSWFTPRIRNFELNLFEISDIWARSLVTAYLTNEIYTSVVMSLLAGQLNAAIKQVDQIGKDTVVESKEGAKKMNKSGKVAKLEVNTEIALQDDNGRLDDIKQNDEESLVLWKDKNSDDVVLTIGKEKVRVDKGKKTLFEASRASENEINSK